MKDKCYYDEPAYCSGELWTCETCGETYCESHWHETDKGRNVECVACEGARREARKRDRESVDRP